MIAGCSPVHHYAVDYCYAHFSCLEQLLLGLIYLLKKKKEQCTAIALWHTLCNSQDASILLEEGPLFRCYWHMPSANWKAPSSRYLECLSLLVEESRTLKAGDVCVQNVGGQPGSSSVLQYLPEMQKALDMLLAHAFTHSHTDMC